MYRLIYKSQPTTSLNWEKVREILVQSERNNEEQDITGVLLATEHSFLQVIEGKYETVNQLFVKIVSDSRHSNIQLISFDLIDSRLFSGWGMKGLGLFDFNTEEARMLKKKYGEDNEDIHFPLESWQVLSLINDLKMVRGLPEWRH
ncbi:MAG: BLUF domain-containing protein [Neptuniibacter sp.]